MVNYVAEDRLAGLPIATGHFEDLLRTELNKMSALQLEYGKSFPSRDSSTSTWLCLHNKFTEKCPTASTSDPSPRKAN